MRLTEKKEKYIEELKTNGHIYFVDDILPNNCKLTSKSIDKLGHLEDLEEELGIDLITLFKALRENGIWVRWNNQIVNIEPDYLRVEIDCSKPLIGSIKIQELYFEDLDWVMDTTGKEWFMDEYGKTWALIKEELENE